MSFSENRKMVIIIKNEIVKLLEKSGVKIIEYKRYVYNRCRISGENPQNVAARWITLPQFKLRRFNEAIISGFRVATYFPTSDLFYVAAQTAAANEAAANEAKCWIRNAQESYVQTVESLKEYIDQVKKAAEAIRETAHALNDMKRSIPKIIKRYPLVRRVAKCAWNDQCSRRPRYVARSTL